jgi:hypothetical protein
MSNPKSSQTTRVARINQAIAGIQKYLVSVPSLVLSAVPYTPAQLQALLQAYVTAITGLKLLHAQLHTAASGEKAQAAQIDELLTALEAYVVNMFGPKAEQVTEFGFQPRKVAVLSAAEKAASKAKAAATRKAKKAALDAVTTPATPTVTAGPVEGTPPVPAAVVNGAPLKS